MPAMLTVQEDGEGNPVAYGSTCPEHPEYDRRDLAQRHAMNVVAKHNRENHAEPVLNLSAAAIAYVNGRSAEAAMEALTGLSGETLDDYMTEVAMANKDVLVHIAPF